MPEIGDVRRYLEEFSLTAEVQQSFTDNRRPVQTEVISDNNSTTPFFINEFWTARQRQAASIHEISYRACFKPQLPRFFINLLTEPGQTVYDPFAGRGTTAIEAALMKRRVITNDINPLSRVFTEPRLEVPPLDMIRKRLKEIPLNGNVTGDLDLSMFYHPKTESELYAMRSYFIEQKKNIREDAADRWIRMVATNRLSGHSKGFFSVYTLPPNQAVSIERQEKINRTRGQKPEYRDVKAIIFKKSSRLLRNISAKELKLLQEAAKSALFLEKDASKTAEIAAESVDLTVTSPPFLNVVQYSKDNWLRCWFNDINTDDIEQRLTMAATLNRWSAVMSRVFMELYRITRPGGWIAFEVGEIRGGTINLEDSVIPLGLNSGFKCAGVVINRQKFTKTANIWGVNNNRSGTNSNRIVLFHKHS